MDRGAWQAIVQGLQSGTQMSNKHYYCSMSDSNCGFLNCIQVSQGAGKVVWYFHHFNNFPQFVVIHIVKGFRVVNEEGVDVFLEFFFFFFFSFNFYFYFILLYNTVLVLPYIDMNPPRVNMSSQT